MKFLGLSFARKRSNHHTLHTVCRRSGKATIFKRRSIVRGFVRFSPAVVFVYTFIAICISADWIRGTKDREKIFARDDNVRILKRRQFESVIWNH